MAIIVNLDMMLAKRKMTSLELANRVGMTPANLSILKTGKAKAVRMSTMDAICRELQCQPGDLFEFVQDDAHGNAEKGDIYGRTDAVPVSCGKTGTDFGLLVLLFGTFTWNSILYGGFVWDLPWGRWL